MDNDVKGFAPCVRVLIRFGFYTIQVLYDSGFVPFGFYTIWVLYDSDFTLTGFSMFLVFIRFGCLLVLGICAFWMFMLEHIPE